VNWMGSGWVAEEVRAAHCAAMSTNRPGYRGCTNTHAVEEPGVNRAAHAAGVLESEDAAGVAVVAVGGQGPFGAEGGNASVLELASQANTVVIATSG
jgi:hypothetical protein